MANQKHSKYIDGDTIYLDRTITEEDYKQYKRELAYHYDIILERNTKYNRIIKYTGKETKE